VFFLFKKIAQSLPTVLLTRRGTQFVHIKVRRNDNKMNVSFSRASCVRSDEFPEEMSGQEDVGE